MTNLQIAHIQNVSKRILNLVNIKRQLEENPLKKIYCISTSNFQFELDLDEIHSQSLMNLFLDAVKIELQSSKEQLEQQLKDDLASFIDPENLEN